MSSREYRFEQQQRLYWKWLARTERWGHRLRVLLRKVIYRETPPFYRQGHFWPSEETYDRWFVTRGLPRSVEPLPSYAAQPYRCKTMEQLREEIAGEEPASSAAGVRGRHNAAVASIVNGGRLPGQPPTPRRTVTELRGDPARG